jgi:hypothetical protein
VVGFELADHGSIPASGKFFVHYAASRPALGPTQPGIQWVPLALSPEGKRSRREADLSTSSSAEVKNGGATPPVRDISHVVVLIHTGAFKREESDSETITLQS